MSTDSGESDSITGMEGRSGLCVPSCSAPSCLGALGWRWLGELLVSLLLSSRSSGLPGDLDLGQYLVLRRLTQLMQKVC